VVVVVDLVVGVAALMAVAAVVVGRAAVLFVVVVLDGGPLMARWFVGSINAGVW
jgi:hypothetical protein